MKYAIISFKFNVNSLDVGKIAETKLCQKAHGNSDNYFYNCFNKNNIFVRGSLFTERLKAIFEGDISESICPEV